VDAFAQSAALFRDARGPHPRLDQAKTRVAPLRRRWARCAGVDGKNARNGPLVDAWPKECRALESSLFEDQDQ
jgi:hypothetical protein